MRQNELVAVVLAIGLLFGEQIVDAVKGKLPSPAPVVVPVTLPDAQAQKTVEPVAALAKQNPDSLRYASYWADMAQLVRLKPGAFSTTKQFRDFHEQASKLFFDLEGGQSTGLSVPTEAAIFEFFGADQTKLDDAKAIRAFEALSWACNQ